MTTTTLHPSAHDFADADRAALAQLLRDPLLATAVNTALREAQPDAHSLAKLTTENQAAIANQLAGMSELLRRLKTLSTEREALQPARNVAGGGEWEDLPSSPTT